MLKSFMIVNMIVVIVNSQNVTISLHATELRGCDLFPSKCDAYVIFRCSSFDYDWVECGRTKKIQDNNNPIWSDVLAFEHKPSNGERWRFDLWDADLGNDELIALFPILIVDDLLSQPQDVLELKTNDGRGSLWIKSSSAKNGKINLV